MKIYIRKFVSRDDPAYEFCGGTYLEKPFPYHVMGYECYIEERELDEDEIFIPYQFYNLYGIGNPHHNVIMRVSDIDTYHQTIIKLDAKIKQLETLQKEIDDLRNGIKQFKKN